MDHNTHLLNDIISVAKDGADFYDQAQRQVDDPQLRQVFSRMAGAKRELISGLSSQVRNLGQEPPRDGTALGSLRETYTKLRAALGRDDAKLYAQQLEQAEDRLLDHMRTAVREAGPEIRGSLETYLPEVQACHDEMRNLKHTMTTPASSRIH